MQGDRQVLQALNKTLRVYLTSINQYFLHARMHKNWGFTALGKYIYKESIADMKFADDIIERILILEGLPNLQDLGKLYIGEAAIETIKCDIRIEELKDEVLMESIKLCEEKQDFVTRALLEKLKKHNEDHWDWLELQLDLVNDLGESHYLQTVIETTPE
ncbi:Bacterioferritin [Oligella ureolytica]|uniref:bacterioferritin n=1 Tax=Oligella ureolytica TaxID=90244 RepID=UPI000DF890C4|nr:bacterioferritin [Oligella ureolytica]SUA58871.1 Bacterioferritin [Oligella ureolytica]